jgi:hypothetical protein
MKKEGTGEQQEGKKWVRFPGYFHNVRNLNWWQQASRNEYPGVNETGTIADSIFGLLGVGQIVLLQISQSYFCRMGGSRSVSLDSLILIELSASRNTWMNR